MDNLELVMKDMAEVKADIDKRYEKFTKLILEGRELLTPDERYMFDVLGVGKRLLFRIMENNETVFKGTEIFYVKGGIRFFDFEDVGKFMDRILMGELGDVVCDILKDSDYIEGKLDRIQSPERARLIQYIISKKEFMAEVDPDDEEGYIDMFAGGVINDFRCEEL